NVLFGQAPVGRLIVPARARSQAGLRRPKRRVGGRLRPYSDDSPSRRGIRRSSPVRPAAAAPRPPPAAGSAPPSRRRGTTPRPGAVLGLGLAGKTPPNQAGTGAGAGGGR